MKYKVISDADKTAMETMIGASMVQMPWAFQQYYMKNIPVYSMGGDTQFLLIGDVEKFFNQDQTQEAPSANGTVIPSGPSPE